jgi:hypothetical protein
MKRNAALEPFSRLVGAWTTVGKHPCMPDTVLHGRTSFEWLEGGAFLLMRSEIDEPGIPKGIAIFASDDAVGELSMLTFDERGVSRRYGVAMRDTVEVVAGIAELLSAIHVYYFGRWPQHGGERGNVEGRRIVGEGPRAHVYPSDVSAHGQRVLVTPYALGGR